MSLQTTQVELKSVGLVLTLSQSNWMISRKKSKLEEEAKLIRQTMIEAGDITLLNEEEQTFREIFYPPLAACVVSNNCPDVQTCLYEIHEDDLELWYAACKKINPGWFVVLDKIAELAVQQEQEQADAALKKGMTNLETTPEEKMLAVSSTGS